MRSERASENITVLRHYSLMLGDFKAPQSNTKDGLPPTFSTVFRQKSQHQENIINIINAKGTSQTILGGCLISRTIMNNANLTL